MTSPDDDFLNYKREFYRLRYEFFNRGKEPDGECLSPESCQQAGAVLCENCHEWAVWEVTGASYRYLAEHPDSDTTTPPDDPGNLWQFTVDVNISDPMKQIKAEIKRQEDIIMQRIREARANVIVRGYHFGNRSGQKDTLTYWRKCLDVYDMRHNGVSWQEIGQKYDNGYRAGSPYGDTGKIKPKGSYTSEARKLYKEAERLINSANNGTFPD